MKNRWYKDPLVMFFAVGLVLFFSAGGIGDDERLSIEVRSQDIDRLAQQWSLQMRREPSTRELDGLVDQYLKEEIYYREALHLGLDRDDTIVRRRMLQKLTFLTEDLAVSDAPTGDTLKQYHQANSEQYKQPKRYSFQHRYFSTDRRDNAEQIAAQAVTEKGLLGDPFMLQRQYAQRSEREIGDLFGREFATALAALKPDQQWQGPLRSAYGWHVIQLSDTTPSRVIQFDEIQERVLADWQQTQRQTANEEYYRSLRERYQVQMPEPAATATQASAP